MRRHDKEITDRAAIDSIIERALVFRLGLSSDDQPYIVPLCFGYEDGALYAHSAPEGRKLDVLRANDAVCVEFDVDHQLIAGEHACAWGMKYRSVIGFGRAVLVDSVEAKREACAIIMRHYSDRRFEVPDEELARITIIKVEIETLTGKQSGY